jgi:hypothetical protein
MTHLPPRPSLEVIDSISFSLSSLSKVTNSTTTQDNQQAEGWYWLQTRIALAAARRGYTATPFRGWYDIWHTYVYIYVEKKRKEVCKWIMPKRSQAGHLQLLQRKVIYWSVWCNEQQPSLRLCIDDFPSHWWLELNHSRSVHSIGIAILQNNARRWLTWSLLWAGCGHFIDFS